MSEKQSRAKDEPVDMPSARETETLPPRDGPAGAPDQFPTIGAGPALVDDAGTQPAVPGYEILAELGRGGMGVVYKARQITLNRPVALKMILAGEFADAAARQRFLAEAEAIARLQHPHIVQVYEFSTFGQKPYFALEYVAGGSLAQKLAGTPQQPHYAAELVEKLARAMQAAHDKGIVHRDLKPANVLLVPPLPSGGEGPGVRGLGEPKITDFGLAKQFDATNPDRKAGEPGASAPSGLTATGAVLGTPSYMAPEQAGGNKTIGPAADIYALGAILYECLTGRPPFKAATPLDTVLQVVKEEPVPPSQLIAKTPRDLETICLKCLQKEPGKRYGSAEGLAQDLRAFLDGRPIQARPVGRMERTWRWCRRNPVGAALLLSLVIGTGVAAGLAIWALIERDRADSEAATAQANETLAKDSEAEAKKNETRAKEQEDAAKQNAAESRRLVCRFSVTTGLRDMDEGHSFRGLLWFAEPLLRDPMNVEMEAATRHRLATYRRYQAPPTLTQVLFHDGSVAHAEFSPDLRRVLTAGGNIARVWDATTGQPVSPPLQHESSVWHAAFSPDGRRVVTDSSDNRARVWDAATGQLVSLPLQHQSRLIHPEFSPDGRRVVTASSGTTARVWDADTGQPVSPPVQHGVFLKHAAFSPDGGRILTAGDKPGITGEARVWDATTGQPVSPPLQHQDGMNHAAFSPDGRRVVTASQDKTARVWDATTGQPVSPPLQHQSYVIHAAFSPDGRRVVTASQDKTARVWDATTGQPVSPPLQHEHIVVHAAFSPDGRRVVTASADRTARVWDATTGQPVSPALQHRKGVRRAAFSPDGRRVVTVVFDNTARVWDMGTGQPVTPLLAHQSLVSHAEFSPDGRRVVTASSDKSARVWDADTGQPVSPLLQHQSYVTHAAFSPDGRRVVTASADNTARVWDAATGQPVTPPLVHQGEVRHAAFSHDGRRVVTAGGGYGLKIGEARVWDADTGQPVSPLLQHQRYVTHAAFSPDGRRVVTASSDRTARVWEADTGQPVCPPLQHQGSVQNAAFSPDGRRVVTASADSTARVWDADTGQPVCPPLQNQGYVAHAAFSPDGRRVVTASHANTARVWDPDTGQPVGPPLQHGNFVSHASFSAVGRRVVTASQDKTARVWDAGTGQPLTPPLAHQGAVRRAAFSPDGRRIVTASGEAARIWYVSPDERPAGDLISLAQLLSGHQVDDTGALAPVEPNRLQELWTTLRAKYPQDFTVTPEQALAWHQREAEACVEEKNWEAALFHANRMNDLEPRTVNAWLLKGKSYFQTLRPFEAQFCFAQARALMTPGQRAAWDQGRAQELPEQRKLGALDHYRLGLALTNKGDWPAAIVEYQKAIELDPKYHPVHYSLGVALSRHGKLDEAAACYKNAIELNPDYAEAHCNLGEVLQRRGKFAEALVSRQRGHELGSKNKDWRYPSAAWVKECERPVELDKKLPAILRGDEKPASPAERLEYAWVCYYKQLYGSSVSFAVQAFAEKPDLLPGGRYNAACCAAMAGSGQGKYGPPPDAAAQARWRQQALDWLRADLVLHGKRLASEKPEDRAAAQRWLRHCQTDPDLAGVRDEAALAKVPGAERETWRKFWAEVAERLQRTENNK